MALYAQVGIGSRGDPVKKLQKNLNQNGYKLSEDGIFGNETLKAVKDYQSQNGLDVDGIVGNQTWNALAGSGAVAGAVAGAGASGKSAVGTGTNNANKNTGFTYDEFTYDDYAESETVSQALATLDSQLGAKPGDYQSTWQGKIDSIIDKILNREDFSYDLNSDALYQQYKDQYTQQGKLAMADTMGQAAALTGGYGSSYATAAGNQAYQAYLSQLNEVVPELYGMALDRYNQEGEELYNNYALLADQESQEYGRHQDEYNKWLNETQLAYDRYDTERNFDYNDYINDLNFEYGVYSDDKSYAYNDYRNAIADEQWQKEFNEQVRQYNEQMAFQKQQYKDSKAASQSGGGSSGSSSGGSSSGGSSGNGSTDKGTGGSGGSPTSKITDEIRNKAASFENNDALADWAYGLSDAGTITEDEADMLVSEFQDPYEVYKYSETDDEGKTTYKARNKSYSEMIESTNGWSIVDNGGVNWFWGVDNNAIVKAPNGEQIRLDNLVERLVKEGMSKSDAKNAVKKFQKNIKV